MSESMAYAAFRPCGCMCAAAVDNPEHRDDWAGDVADWLRAGFRVERVTCAAVRVGKWECRVCQPDGAQEALPL